MRRLFKIQPFIITLLTVLLLCNIVSGIGLDLVQHQLNTAENQEKAPSASIETLITRIATPRLHQSEAQPPSKDPTPWPITLPTSTSFIDLFRVVRKLPHSYLLFDSYRLAGWQETNLQFRFIHSR